MCRVQEEFPSGLPALSFTSPTGTAVTGLSYMWPWCCSSAAMMPKHEEFWVSARQANLPLENSCDEARRSSCGRVWEAGAGVGVLGLTVVSVLVYVFSSA